MKYMVVLFFFFYLQENGRTGGFGCYGHLSARDSSSPHASQGSQPLQEECALAMRSLEQTCCTPYHDLSSNQVCCTSTLTLVPLNDPLKVGLAEKPITARSVLITFHSLHLVCRCHVHYRCYRIITFLVFGQFCFARIQRLAMFTEMSDELPCARVLVCVCSVLFISALLCVCVCVCVCFLLLRGVYR